MPRQEEASIERIKRIVSIIRENKSMLFKDLEAWCQINQGITGRTVGRYVNALATMQVIKFNPHTQILEYVEKVKS